MDSHYAYTPYIWPMLAPAVFTAALVVFVWRRRSVPGALPLALAMLFTIPLAVGAALEVAAVDVPTKVFWVKFQAIWILPTNTAMLCSVLEYADSGRWLTRRTLTLLAIPPLLYLVLILTNDVHRWLWLEFLYEGYVLPVYGTGTWIMIGYNYLLTALQVIVLFRLFVRSPLHRWLVALVLIARLVGFIAFRLDLTNQNPFAPMDPTVLVITLFAAVYALALFHFRLFKCACGAGYRDRAHGGRHAGAGRREPHRRSKPHGAKAARRLALARGRAGGHSGPGGVSQRDRTHPRPGGSTDRDDAEHGRRATLLSGFRLAADRPAWLSVGHVIVLYDITEVKQARERFLDQQRALATLQERERVARELHDSLGQVLGYVKMQAQAARGLLAQNQSSEADRYLAQLVAVAQDAHADVREYILGAGTGVSADADILSALTQYLRRFSENYGIATELSAPPELSAGALEPMVEVQLLRIIQEALSNVRKHAGARSVRIGLSVYDSRAEAIVQDDGAGFDPEVLETAEGQKFGLRFMRERAAEVGGSVEVHSAPGEGTQVIIGVPLRKDEE